MKKMFVFGALITGLGATQMWATPSPTNPCPTTSTTLSAYLASGFTCQVGDKIFSNFTYTDTSTGALAIGPGAVSVETLGSTTGMDPAQVSNATIGLQFSAGWTALAGQEADSAIGFTVTVVNGSNMLIEDTGLAQTSGVLGSSSLASVSEKACTPIAPATTCTPGTISIMTFDDGTMDSQTVNDVTFSPSGSIIVSKDINVTDSGTSGHAEISVVSDTFSQTAVPEPATMLLVGSVLCGIAAIRRRSVRS